MDATCRARECEGSSLHIDPCIPNSRPGFEISFAAVPPSYTSRSKIRKRVTRGVAAARMDGTLLTQRPLRFELADESYT